MDSFFLAFFISQWLNLQLNLWIQLYFVFFLIVSVEIYSGHTNYAAAKGKLLTFVNLL